MIARILLIVRKDAHRVWPFVLLFWAVIASAVALSSINSDRLRWGRIPLRLPTEPLQWLACGLLITLVIQQERLVGDKQYWLTRPIASKELLAAKALFLIAAVGLPIWVCDRFFIHHYTAPHTAFLILPAIAFATVSSNLGESILALAATYLVVSALSLPIYGQPMPPPPLPNLLAAASSLSVILLQYSRRREALARAILLAGIAALIVSMRF